MGTWRVTSDLLAKARFTVSPKAEAVAALEALVRPSDPAERAFRAAHRVAFEAMLDERPVRRDLVSHSFRPRRGSQSGWVADFLTSPPPAPDAAFEAELADLAATPAGKLRADLRETTGGPLPRSLETGDVTREAVFVLEWIWTHAVATDWPRRERLLRADIARPGWPGQMLVSFSGRTATALPDDDAELWLTLATSVASPQGDPLSEEDREFARAMEWAEDEDLKFGQDLDEPGADSEPDELSAAIAAVCALDHFDWLAVMSALVTGGPGTPASAADLARYVRDFDPDEVIGLKVAVADDAAREAEGDADFDAPGLDGSDFDDYEDEFDELSIEGLFLHVTAMWSVLGAIDEDDRLTPLGWWGLPEAMRRAWTE